MAKYFTEEQMVELFKRFEVMIGCTARGVLTRELKRMDEGVVRCANCQKRNTDDCAMYYEINGKAWHWESDEGFCHCGYRGAKLTLVP